MSIRFILQQSVHPYSQWYRTASHETAVFIVDVSIDHGSQMGFCHHSQATKGLSSEMRQ
jgi:hypothetical protein